MSSNHAILGASSAERWLNCTPSALLTADMPDTASAYAAEGTLAHKLCELAVRENMAFDKSGMEFDAKYNAIQTDPNYTPEMESAALDYIEAINEIFYGFPSTPYLALEQRVDFSEYVPDGFGTADCVLIGSGILHIVDFKYGKGVPVSPVNNAQLMLYALGAYLRYQPLYDILRVRWTIVQPRNGGVSETQEKSAAWLINWAENNVKPRAEQASTGEGDYAVGEWCRFCKARSTCRARAEYNLALEGFSATKPPLLDSSEIGDALKRATDLKSWLSDLEEYTLSAVLTGREIPGWKAVEGRSVRAWTDQEAAFQAIISDGTPEAMLYERKPVTLAATEKLLGKKAFKSYEAWVTVPPGKPTLAPETDKRPAITNKQSAENDFAQKEENNE